jgi:S-adenosylmethionine:tRNA ribosyltransferase-isomerase
MYRVEDYHYELPAGLIAQVPAGNRGSSRLMVVKRAFGSIEHRGIADLEQYLGPDDLVVLNDTRVVPARLVGHKESGGQVEVLVLNPATDESPYRCLIKAAKPPKQGAALFFGDGVRATLREPVRAGQTRLEFPGDRALLEVLESVGRVPLPPYIRRNGQPPAVDDAQAYQTVYAVKPGAVAAPTAGLHFSEEFLDRLGRKGVSFAKLTLHVGFGTFEPVRVTDIRQHRLHEEFFEIPEETAVAVRRAREEGKRIVAVGTTTVRALESAAAGGGVQPGKGWCSLFIYPGYSFRVVDALLTNFHLPGSSLIMLAAAWTGRRLLLDAYAEAIRHRYRFYSYGDAMFIE